MSEMPEKNSQVEHFQVNDLRFDYFLLVSVTLHFPRLHDVHFSREGYLS